MVTTLEPVFFTTAKHPESLMPDMITFREKTQYMCPKGIANLCSVTERDMAMFTHFLLHR